MARRALIVGELALVGLSLAGCQLAIDSELERAWTDVGQRLGALTRALTLSQWLQLGGYLILLLLTWFVLRPVAVAIRQFLMNELPHLLRDMEARSSSGRAQAREEEEEATSGSLPRYFIHDDAEAEAEAEAEAKARARARPPQRRRRRRSRDA